MALDESEPTTAKFSLALIRSLSSVEVSSKNDERRKEIITELGKPYTDLKKLQIMLSSGFLWRDDIQTEAETALHAQHTLIGVLVESWAWRNHLVYIIDPVLREETAKVVRQESAPNKLTVAYIWRYIFAKIKDEQIRQEANQAVTQVSCPDKLVVAELWKDHFQTIPDPAERTSAWRNALHSLQQSEATSTIARRLEMLTRVKRTRL